MIRRIILGLRNAGILALCYGYVAVRGPARQGIRPPKKIIVAAASKLGDMVCATPLFSAIKENYPSCEVIVIGTAPYESLHAGNPCVDQYVVVTERGSFWAGVKTLRAQGADGMCSTAPGFISTAQAFLAGIPTVVVPLVTGGFCPYQTRPYRALWPLVCTKPHDMRRYAPREYLSLLEVFGITAQNTQKHLYCTEASLRFAEQFYADIGYTPLTDCIIGVVPGAGNEVKQWAPVKFARTIEYLRATHGAKIVVLGSGHDKEVIDSVFQNLPDTNGVVNTYGQFSIEQLKAIVSKLTLCVAVDTGIVYVAEAFGVATVDIVGPVDENVQPPRGARHRLVYLEGRAPQLRIMNARVYDHDEARRQIDDITPGMVFKEIDAVISTL